MFNDKKIEELYKKLNSLEYRYSNLEERLHHLENKPKAEKLMKEYKKYIKNSDLVYANNIIYNPGQWGYPVDEFECQILCDLRKKELEKLEKK